jgi:hypothetical protein
MTTTTIFRKNSTSLRGTLAMTALFFCPAAPALAQGAPHLQVCANQGFALVSAEPASGIEPITYEWYENGIPIENSNTASISIAAGKATAGTYQYVRKAANSACTLSSNNYTVEVAALPTITRSGGDASQTVTVNTAITTITYTASDATGIFLSSGTLPPDVTGTPNGTVFTISGTPSATGTFSYAVAASHTSNGCIGTSLSGTITVNAAPTTPPDAASTQTWTIGAQTWSDRLVAYPSSCTYVNTLEMTMFNTTIPKYHCADGHCYYNSHCAYAAQETLCPSTDGWRVPVLADFQTLCANATIEQLASYWGMPKFISLYKSNNYWYEANIRGGMVGQTENPTNASMVYVWWFPETAPTLEAFYDEPWAWLHIHCVKP